MEALAHVPASIPVPGSAWTCSSPCTQGCCCFSLARCIQTQEELISHSSDAGLLDLPKVSRKKHVDLVVVWFSWEK